MNTNDLVPDLKICQEAKEKGVVIESSFYYEIYKDGFSLRMDGEETFNYDSRSTDIWRKDEDSVPAPLTEEILKVLPREIIIEGYTSLLLIAKNEKTYTAGYETDEDELYFIEDKKLSNALLLLAIKLKEEGIIK